MKSNDIKNGRKTDIMIQMACDNDNWSNKIYF